MQPVQYIVARTDLGMSPGKLAAQVAHASVEGLRLNAKTEWGNPWDASIVNRWYQGGHYAKVVLGIGGGFEPYNFLQYAEDRGIKGKQIFDEGRTEFDGGLTLTALGFPVVDKDSQHVRDVFGTLKLWQEPQRPQQTVDSGNARLTHATVDGHWGPHRRSFWGLFKRN